MENKSSKGVSIGALITGIASCGGWAAGYFAIACMVAGIVGIILGSKGKKAAKENGEPAGMATAGMVLGIVGVVLSVIGLICAIAVTCAKNELNGSLTDLANQLATAN